MINYDLEFDMQQVVYLKVDREQSPFIVTSFLLLPMGAVRYGLTDSDGEIWRYGFEISAEKDILLTSTN